MSEVPLRVAYASTPMEPSMLPALEGFTKRIRAHWPAIVRSRRDVDAGATC